MKKIRLVWDFHGEDAEGKAAHHVRHLEEFMNREKIEFLRTVVLSGNEGHHSACMTVNEKDVKVVRDALKPHRAFVVE